jgi:hypothetical protein
VDFPVDNCPETAVFVGEIIVKRLPGDTQLMAQVGNADRRIGPLQEIGIETLLNLFLAAICGRGTGDLGIFHCFLQFWVKFLMLYTITYIIQERWQTVNSQKF